ncbi:glyoxalase [Leifsonia sp. NPDC102414]|uniref:glyoxalase n=1 Tax=Leifsonia sp. NPDC102414 TaxID=3364124 RepID=UPI00381A64D5
MTSIQHITLEVPDLAAAERFYSSAFDLGSLTALRQSDAPTSGFRGFHISLTVAQPSTVETLIDSAVAAGATTLKPVAKSLWGVGGVVQAPDGAIWKVATSAKRDTGPATRAFESLVLLLGAEDIVASKKFYVDHGLTVDKSFGKTYVQFATPKDTVGFGLYRRSALAKDAGVPEEGSGSHRIVIGGDAGAFTDPDGFPWE